MADSGRFPPLQPNDQFRPKPAIQGRRRERLLWDRKAAVRLLRSVRQLIAITGCSRFTSIRRDLASHDVDAESRPSEFLHPTCSNLREAEHVAYDPKYATFASLDHRW